MAMPKPERAIEVLDIDIGIASQGVGSRLPYQGVVSGLAFRFHLRDGSTVVFALPENVASQFAKRIEQRLGEIRGSRSSTRKQ
jgi:hypothetical protein